jgi:hypothetical protein
MKLKKNKILAAVLISVMLIVATVLYEDHRSSENGKSTVCICGSAGGVLNSPCGVAPQSGPCD